MDKRTILFIVVAAVIMAAGLLVNTLLFPPVAPIQETPQAQTSQSSPSTAPTTSGAAASDTAGALVAPSVDASIVDPNRPKDAFIAVESGAVNEAEYVFRNEKYEARFDPRGARLAALSMVEFQDGSAAVQMFFPADDSGISTRFGGRDGQLMNDVFFRKSGTESNVVEFYRDYQRNDQPGRVIRVTKRYTFVPGEYVIKLDVGFEYSINEFLPSSLDGYAYTLSVGPQIGPTSSNIKQNQDIRRLVYHTGAKVEKPGIGLNATYPIKEKINWLAIDGKYFSFIAIPGPSDQTITYSTKEVNAKVPGSQITLSRKTIQASRNVDSIQFYVGPKLAKFLNRFDKVEDNQAGFSGMKFQELADWDPLGWLAEVMKWIMGWFYLLIPNWGVSIILLTILVKAALFPLSKRSAESMARMNELNPQIAKLREKYANDTNRMNQEMAALYQKEKINPLSGCLPLLLQMPFFFAMYGLFNNHFDLRGAMFIPGWINDLSQPESVFFFGSIPPLSWINITDIRLLPIIYVVSQILTTKFTPTSGGAGQTNGQMKFMMYGLPIIFFFMLYNVPAGLLVYWIFQNILSIFQQILVNQIVHKKRAAK